MSDVRMSFVISDTRIIVQHYKLYLEHNVDMIWFEILYFLNIQSLLLSVYPVYLEIFAYATDKQKYI